jgi:ribonucleoside-diphosphate reductase alpha chain
VSGGLEPVISHSYTRTIITSHPPEGLDVPADIIWGKSHKSLSDWKWTKEGDEDILKIKFEGTIYKFDRNRGLTREEDVSDYAVLNMTDFNPKEEYANTLFDLGIDEHIDTMKVFQKFVDNAISKTTNIPNDYPYEDFKNIYMDAWESGLKGMTSYRMGTMTNVVAVKNEDAEAEEVDEIQVRKAPERPDELPCHVYNIKVKGDAWIVFIGLYEEYPYEVFAGKIGDVALPKSIKSGMLVKKAAGKYGFSFDGEFLIKDVIKLFENKEQEALTRMISLSMRHGTPLKLVIEQLSKSNGTIVDFSKSIIRALKLYMKEETTGAKCPNCGEATFYIEGCETCRNCGWSKC